MLLHKCSTQSVSWDVKYGTKKWYKNEFMCFYLFSCMHKCVLLENKALTCFSQPFVSFFACRSWPSIWVFSVLYIRKKKTTSSCSWDKFPETAFLSSYSLASTVEILRWKVHPFYSQFIRVRLQECCHLEHTYLSLLILAGFSWLWGLPQAFIHRRHCSYFILGLGKGKKLDISYSVSIASVRVTLAITTSFHHHDLIGPSQGLRQPANSGLVLL